MLSLFLADILPCHKFSIQTYAQLAQRYKCFQAVCQVHHPQSGAMLTGVLTESNIVVTAAHGFHKRSIKNGWIVILQNGKRYPVDSVEIDDRFYNYHGFKNAPYDMAICKLNKPVTEVRPVKLFESEKISEEALFIAGTFVNNRVVAFQLCEFTKIYSPGVTDETGHDNYIYGSIFQHPEGSRETNNPFLAEQEQRAANARHNWDLHGNLPYALAQPGTSGSPVFVNIDGLMYLFGIITSFTTIDKVFKSPYNNESDYLRNIDRKKLEEKVYNWYQTLVVPFYIERKDNQFNIKEEFKK